MPPYILTAFIIIFLNFIRTITL